MTFAREMQLTRHQSDAALAALTFVVEAGGLPSPRGARLLEVAAETLDVRDDARVRRALSVDSVARAALTAFPSVQARRVLVHGLIVAACIEGVVTPEGEGAVRGIAKVLDVRSHWVSLLPALRVGNALAVKWQLARRSPDARRLFARTWAEDGLRGVGRALLFLLGVYKDPPLAARFHALGQLPAGTLGRALFDHLRGRGLPFPGERGGLPERMLHHDLMHVLNGYETDAAGECAIAGFYAGCTSGDSFTFIVTALATFHLGMRVSPAIVTPERFAFDPERVVAAFLSGRRVRVDLLGPWDYWAAMPLTLDEARAHLERRTPSP